MYSISKNIKLILVLDFVLYLPGICGVYFISLKANLPPDISYGDSLLISNKSANKLELPSGHSISTINGYKFNSAEEFESYLDSFKAGEKIKIVLKNGEQREVVLVHHYSVFYVLLSFLIGTIFFSIAVVVLIKAKAHKPSRVFHWVSVFTALIVMITWGYFSDPKLLGYLMRIILHFSVSMVPVLFIHFTLVFPKQISINKFWYRTLYSIALVIFLLLNYTFFQRVFEVNELSIRNYVLSYNISRYFLILCIIAAILIFVYSYRTSLIETDKRKLKWILYGLVVGPLSFILLWTLPILFLEKSFVPEELILVLISIIPITFAISIIKYHVMDIDKLINRSVVYFFAIGLVLIIYLIFIGVITYLTTAVDLKTLSIITAVIIAVLFQPIRSKTQEFVDRKFFRVKYDFREALKKFFIKIENALDINSLIEVVIENTYGLMPVKRIGFFILAKGDKLKLAAHKNFDFLVGRSIKFQREKLKTDLSLPVAIPESIETGVPIEIADLEVFQRWGIYLVFPVKSPRNEIQGFLVLGEKKSELKFTIEDVDLMNAVINKVAASFDRIRMQEALFEKHLESERLEELNRIKSYFISSVSHDVKTPLTSIKMFAELLQSSEEINSEKAREYLEMIEGESNRLTRLIDNVLDFSKIERGIKEYNFENISLNELVSRTMKLMQYQFNLFKFEVNINLTKDEKIIRADKDALEEALINLLSNSIKYSGIQKGVNISTAFENNFMILSVEDKGIGISSENMEKIFNPFFRIDSSDVRKSGGAGLGLSIAKHIMDAHNGIIEVQSELGKGSKFKLMFPVLNK